MHLYQRPKIGLTMIKTTGTLFGIVPKIIGLRILGRVVGAQAANAGFHCFWQIPVPRTQIRKFGLAALDWNLNGGEHGALAAHGPIGRVGMPRFIAQVGLHAQAGNRKNLAIITALKLYLIGQGHSAKLKGAKARAKADLFRFR